MSEQEHIDREYDSWWDEYLFAPIRYLIDEFGRTDSIQRGLLVNLGMATLGLLGIILTSGYLRIGSAIWIVINLYPVARWVIGR